MQANVGASSIKFTAINEDFFYSSYLNGKEEVPLLKAYIKYMRVGIMQPYFFPYLGYWQLVNAVDKFVILDDVNYIMRGYINRNSILVNGKPHKFSLSIDKPSQNKLINETQLLFPVKERRKLLKTIEMAYHKAICFSDVFPIIENAIMYSNNDLVDFIKNSITLTVEYLGIDTEILVSSEIIKDESKKSQDRIIEINMQLGSDTYINPIGGQSLYNRDDFKQLGIDLYFIEMQTYEYKQFNNDFVPNLSFIDIMMFNTKETIAEMLESYKLIDGGSTPASFNTMGEKI